MVGKPMTARSEAEAQYFAVVEVLVAEDCNVHTDYHPERRKFGSSGELKIQGKIFAFLNRDRLVVKLPKERIELLGQAGVGENCKMGVRVMRQWFAIDPKADVD